MMDSSTFSDLPPLPSYSLTPRPPLVPPLPDKYLTVLLPIVAYWGFSMIFHFIDTRDYFPQYRLHTPAEVLKRNHVSRLEVVRDVVVQQIIQTVVGVVLALMEPLDYSGKEEYNVAMWAQRIRVAQSFIPSVMSIVGLNSKAVAQKVFSLSPVVAGFIAGGLYPGVTKTVDGTAVLAFTSWEMFAAKAIYWVGIPALQFALAIVFVDTWQYFIHRAMHMNKWLYTNFHSRHHRLYVPYAYGALYNHPVEAFFLDTLGACIAYLVAGLTPRQGLCFFVGSTIKTVDDHSGYALPWDPLQHLTSNNAGYHDVHHQSWGIKTNFSQPFFTFWDRALGTVWTGGDVSARYERTRLAAERKAGVTSSITGSRENAALSEGPCIKEGTTASLSAAGLSVPTGKATRQAADSTAQVLTDQSAGGPAVLAEEAAEERSEVQRLFRRSPRQTLSGSSTGSQSAGLKGWREIVSTSASFHGRKAGVLGYESGR